MGVLKKLLGIDDMDTVELGTLRAEAEDIRKLIRIGHKDKKLLEEIKEEILKIYLDIGSDARLKNTRIFKAYPFLGSPVGPG